MGQFVIARNPRPDSGSPFLLRVPLGSRGVVFEARGNWPRTNAVQCQQVDVWPDDLEVLERIPVRSCSRRGNAIELVLDRGREHRSQFVFGTSRGRETVLWQSTPKGRQSRAAARPSSRPADGMPTLEILVDDREQYPYRFADARVRVARRTLPAGDYAIALDGRLVAAVERKSLPDLIASLDDGSLRPLLAGLAALPRAALVVEERFGSVYRLDRPRPHVVAEQLADLQVAWPAIPVFFAGSRQLAEAWTYRWLAACARHATEDQHGLSRLADLPVPEPPLAPEPSAAEVRAWARDTGLDVGTGGRIPATIRQAYRQAHASVLG